MMSATCIFVDGPFPNANARSDWDEFPEWTVCLMDDDGCEIGKIHRTRTENAAINLGERMSRDRKLELVIESTPW